MRVLQFFRLYTDKLGWEIIPLLPKSKLPFMKGWNKNYDRHAIKKYLEENPGCNIGLRLGTIIDVEADTPEANDLLSNLVGDVPHPMYESQKSVHHLFLNPDNTLTRTVVRGIEFRGHLHQSALPPSVNANGVEYKWLDSKFPIPAMPGPLLDLYNDHVKIAKNHVEPWCSGCLQKVRINRNRYVRESAAFSEIGHKWLCHRCRDRKDVRPTCRKVKNSSLAIC